MDSSEGVGVGVHEEGGSGSEEGGGGGGGSTLIWPSSLVRNSVGISRKRGRRDGDRDA